MHEQIEAILDTVTCGGKRVPYALIRYTKTASLYIVYTILYEVPRVCADDAPETSVVEIDVDIYAKDLGKMSETKDSVKSQFIAAGWTWTEDGPELYDETGYIHITVTLKKERMIQ